RDLRIELFGGATEAHPLQSQQLDLQLLDQHIAREQLLACCVELFFLCRNPRVLLDDELLQRINILGKGNVRHRCILLTSMQRCTHKIPINQASLHAATCGVCVRCGRRQSMPSNSIDNCARLKCTTPLSACGQMNRPRSSRLANKHKPSPSHHSSFTRSPRRPRNTNNWPENGSSANCTCTMAASPSKPLRISVAPQAIQMRPSEGKPIIAHTARRRGDRAARALTRHEDERTSAPRDRSPRTHRQCFEPTVRAWVLCSRPSPE